MTVLGLDLGLAALGWGIVAPDGARPRHVAHGVFTTRPTGLSRAADTAARCAAVAGEVRRLLDVHDHDEVAFETFVPQGRIVTSAFALSQVAGAVREVLAARYTDVGEYDTCAIKRGVCGSSRVDKGMVQRIVRTRLGLTTLPRPSHAADALAVAIFHAGQLRQQGLMRRAVG